MACGCRGILHDGQVKLPWYSGKGAGIHVYVSRYGLTQGWAELIRELASQAALGGQAVVEAIYGELNGFGLAIAWSPDQEQYPRRTLGSRRN